jgi:hypothetical protein
MELDTVGNPRGLCVNCLESVEVEDLDPFDLAEIMETTV